MSLIFKKKGAFKGIRLPHNKITENKPIEKLPLPQKIILPIQQHIGAPCEHQVKRGDKVNTGQKIAESKSFVSAPIHSSISGEVSRVIKIINPPTSLPIDAVVINSDGEDKWIKLNSLPDIKGISNSKDIINAVNKIFPKEMITRVKEAGIVGLGGATFPTHIKLSPPPGKKIDTIILNGCECEPYITSDHRLLLEHGEKILLGFYIISKILLPEKILIAIEDNKKDAIANIKNLIIKLNFEKDFEIISLESKYPMGAEKTLIKTILKREVPIDGLPLDVGVVVHNVATCKAIYDAVIYGRPLIEKVVTVTGDVLSPKNLLVRIGTPIKNLIDYCGGLKGNSNEIIVGGPMMGIDIVDLDFPVTKGTNCILVKKEKPIDEKNCIRCARCIDACPMKLMPLMYVENVKKGFYEACKDYFITDCIECGCCSYVCPSNIPIVGYIKTGKSEL